MSGRPAWLSPVEDVLRTGAALFAGLPAPPADARPSAVLVLFGDGPDLLLTERSSGLRSHPGQLSFPGGSADPDDAGPVYTALREAREEVGLDPADVEVLGTLPPLWLPPSNFAVTPVLAWEARSVRLSSVDASEVASVLRVPVATLVEPRHRFTARHPLGYRGPAFELEDGLVLWGFTAGVISALLDATGWSRPWDASTERPLPVSGGARR